MRALRGSLVHATLATRRPFEMFDGIRDIDLVACQTRFYHPVVEEGLRTALQDARSKLHARRGETESALAAAAGCQGEPL